MERIPVDSSNINSVGYDPQSETLEIEFHSGGIYQYSGVPEHVYEQMIEASSKGQFFHAYIRDQYPYSRVG